MRGRRAELEETVRFRLHKALPADFDVRSARLAWRAVSADELLVAVARDEVVRPYEEALEALGFHPGLVEPAGPRARVARRARGGRSRERCS